MGNLAVKCEDLYQMRKVGARHMGGTLDVRVMKADGSGVEEFDRSVSAAEVMYQFPDYVVVQWCPIRNLKFGKREALTVLRGHEELNPGQTYALFPIPAEIAMNTAHTAARRSRRTQFSKDRLSLLLQRAETATAAGAASGQSLGDEKTSDDRNSDGKKTQWQSKVEKDVSSSEDERPSGKPTLYLSPFFSGGSWTPALGSIPESPMGFHSRPESPMAPVAFRIVSNREQHCQ